MTPVNFLLFVGTLAFLPFVVIFGIVIQLTEKTDARPRQKKSNKPNNFAFAEVAVIKFRKLRRFEENTAVFTTTTPVLGNQV